MESESEKLEWKGKVKSESEKLNIGLMGWKKLIKTNLPISMSICWSLLGKRLIMKIYSKS